MKLGKFGSFVAAVSATLVSSFAFGETYSQNINLNTYDDSKVFNVNAGDTCNLSFSGATYSKKFAKEGNGNITIDGNADFTLASFSWKGAGVLTVNDTTFNVSGIFGTSGNWNEQSNVFNNCTLTAGTFHNDCSRNRLHYGYTFFNGGTYTFDKLYVTGSDSGSGSVVTVQGGAQVKVNTELFCVRLTSGDPGVARLVVEDGSVTTPQINLGWANATLKQGAVELLGGTLTTKTIVNGPGNADYVLGNGGTFVPTTKNTDILPSNIEHVYIGEDGLTVKADVDVTISKPFEPWTPEEGFSETGALYKTGAGTLTLSGDASAHARTVISEGQVVFGADVATHPAVTVTDRGLLDFTGVKTKLAGLKLDGGTFRIGIGDTVVLTEPDSFEPTSVLLSLPDIQTPHTVYNMVKVPGRVSAQHAEEWSVVNLPEVPEIVHEFSTVYDEAADETTFVLTVNVDANVKREVTVSATEGGSVDFENGKYLVDTELTLTADPLEGYSFVGWTGSVAAGHEFDNPLTFVVGGEDIALTANFAETTAEIDIDLSGGDVTVAVGPGCLRTVRNFTGNASATLSIVGGGTFTMPEAATKESFAALVIDGAMVDVATIGQLGGGDVTLKNGGGIHATGKIDMNAHKIVIEDVGTLAIDEGIEFLLRPAYFSGTGKTLVKTGRGTLNAAMQSSATTFPTSGRWLIKEGTLTSTRGSNASSAFCFYETDASALEVEVSEGATFSTQGIVPKVILRGGRLTCSANGRANTVGDVADTTLYTTPNSPTGPMLNGGLYAYPSESGVPSVVDANMLCFSQVDRAITEIFVDKDAELDVRSTLSVRKQSASDVDFATVRKTGDGVMRLFRPVAAEGVLRVEAGTVALADDVVCDSDKFAVVGAGGKIHLSDGSMLVLSASDPVLASAEVWVDGSRDSSADTVKPNRIANYGVNGGGLAYSGIDGSQLSVAKNAVGELTAYRAGGAQGTWMNYANDGTAMTTFVVARNNSWADAGGKGKSGSPIQIGGDGNPGAPGVFHYDFSAENAFKVVFGSTVQTFTDQGISPGSTNLFLNETVWSGTTGSFRQYWSDDADPLTWTGTVTAFPSGKFTRLALGCKMYTSGIYCRGSNAMVGDICEVLVFNRVLSDDETAYVRSYLQRKWFGSNVAPVELPEVKPSATLEVDVDAEATAAVRIGQNVQIGKGGAGRLFVTDAGGGSSGALSVEEGTLQVSTNGWRNYAAVWVDATDEKTIQMDGERVDSLVNKGVLGGSFTTAVNYTGTEARPTLGEINGKTALAFDGTQGLWFDGLSLLGSRADTPVYIYMVAERTSMPSLGARSPFMLADKDCTALRADGAFYYDDATYREKDTKINIYAGKSATQIVYDQADSNVPFLDVFELRDNFTFYSQMTAEKSPDNGPRNVYATIYEVSNKVNRVILGGSYKNGTLNGEVKAGHNTDYAWDGRIGEFIIVTKTLSYAEEKDLLNYLYNKWIAVEPQAVAKPSVLGGGSTAFAGGDLDLSFADGTAIDFESPVVDVRDLFFAGDMALWYAPVPKKGGHGDVFRYSGSATGFDPKAWAVTGGPVVKGRLSVVNENETISLNYDKFGLQVLVR